MNYRIIYSDELYHHGVKGMKWGVRKERQPSDGNPRKRKRGLTNGQKIAIGMAAIAVTGAVLYKTGSFDKIAVAGRRAINKSKARKLGLKVVQNTEKTRSKDFEDIMSRMNSAANAGHGPSKSYSIGVAKSTRPSNSLEGLSLSKRHAASVQRGPTPGYAKDRFGETVYRTKSPKLTKASSRLMTPLGAEHESAMSYHAKADKLSRDLFNNRVADSNIDKAVSNKRLFDARGDKAAEKVRAMYRESLSNKQIPRHYSQRKVKTLKSNASSSRGKDAFRKIQSSMAYSNLTYADLEKLDLF